MNFYECQILLGYEQITCHITSINNELAHEVPVKFQRNKNERNRTAKRRKL